MNSYLAPRALIVLLGFLAAVVLFWQISFAASSNSLVPTSVGNYNQWTTSGSSTHYVNVDESPCNLATDFNSTTVVGNRDSYGVSLSSVPSGATITDISVKPCAARGSAGATDPVMKVFYRLNGIDSADSAGYTLNSTTFAELATSTYSGLSKVKGATTTFEIGAVLASGTKGAKLSRIQTQITYTPLTAPSGLTTSSTTASTTKLTWSDNSSNETGFSVERSTDGSIFTGIASTSANATTYNDSGLAANTAYYYRVRGFNSGAYSAFTNVATTTTLGTIPAAPSSLVDTATTTSAIGLTWTDNSSNEDGFNVERSTNNFNWSAVASTSPDATSYYDSGLSAGTHYFHRVRAFNAAGYSSYSNSANATTTVNPPAAPSALSATSSQTLARITLGWTDNSSDETAFEVLRSTDGINFSHLASTSANVISFTNTGLASSTTYYYQVHAYNSGGYSSVSNTASDTTATWPDAASGMTATASTTAPSIALSWTDNATNELNYRLEVSSSSPTSGFIATGLFLPANTTSVNYTPLFANTLYYFHVLAGNGYGTTTSDTASTTSAGVPTAPTDLSLMTAPGASSTTDITLNWTDNATTEWGYKVERDSGGGFSQIATTSVNAITYTNFSRPNGTYSYRVRAYNGVGNSAFSNEASTTVP